MTRTITDPSELDALPPWTVVEDALGFAWVRHPGVPDLDDHWVSYYGSRVSAQYVVAESPLTVLHDPSVPGGLAASDVAAEAVARCPWANWFHARIDDVPDLFHVKCSQHPEFGFCGSEEEAAQARVEHLATHEVSAASVAPTHICTAYCEQGRGHYEVMTAAPVVPVVPEAVVEVAARALRIAEVGDSATPGFAARQWDNGSANREKPMRLARAALEAALPHLAAVPFVVPEAVTRGLAQSAAGETVDLGDFTQYVVPEAAALLLLATVSSATREDVVKVLMDHAHDEGVNACECGDWSEWGEEDWDARAAAWSAHVHDALLARFTITPKGTDR